MWLSLLWAHCMEIFIVKILWDLCHGRLFLEAIMFSLFGKATKVGLLHINFSVWSALDLTDRVKLSFNHWLRSICDENSQTRFPSLLFRIKQKKSTSFFFLIFSQEVGNFSSSGFIIVSHPNRPSESCNLFAWVLMAAD